MGAEQMQSPPPSETTDFEMPDVKGEEQSMETAAPVAESATSVASPPVPSNRRAVSNMTELRRIERYRVTLAVKRFLKSDKSALVGRNDRIDMLYEIRDKCIADMERAGMGSMRERFPADFNEEEDRSRLVKVFSEYISSRDSPLSGKAPQKLVQGSMGRAVQQGKSMAGEVNQDDEEPEPVRWKIKKEIKEEPRDDLVDVPEISKSGMVAGMAIMRGFRDARMAVDPAPKTSIARIWKQIGGKWMPMPSFSTGATTGSTKRKSESVDREGGRKRVKLE